MTIIEKYVDLPPSVKRLLEKVAGQEFGNIPIVRETTWSVPEWTAICYLGNEVAAFCSIVSRIIFMNGTFYKAAGLHNLITLERFRGKGLATDLLLKSENFMFEGLLWIWDYFYVQINWYHFTAKGDGKASLARYITTRVLLRQWKKRFGRRTLCS